MKQNDSYIVDLYHDELTKLEEKERKKIEKFKKKEERKKRREEKKLEKIEDREFAKKQKMSRESRYIESKKNIKDNHTLISNIYKITILLTLFMTISYFLYSLIKRQIHIFNTILFLLIVLGFILTATIQKKKERKIVSIITCFLYIIWMLLHL